MDVERLYQTYKQELSKLVAINEKGDFSADGEAEYRIQYRIVEVAKRRLISAQNAQYERAS
jgi:hypothetical protein